MEPRCSRPDVPFALKFETPVVHPYPSHPQSAPPSSQARAQAVSRTAIVGAAINLVLSAIKIAGGVLGHSQALVADGIHSLSDLKGRKIMMSRTQEADMDGKSRDWKAGDSVVTLPPMAAGIADLHGAAEPADDRTSGTDTEA